MTRIEEIMEKQKALTDMVNKFNENELIQDQHQITNINLTVIAEQLMDISLSLAMLMDNLKKEN